MGTLSAHPSFAHPGKTARNPARRRRPFRAVLLVLLALVILIPASAGAYLFNLGRIFDSETTKIENAFPDEATRPLPSVPGGAAGGAPGAGPAAAGTPASDSGRSLNILVMGSDSRGATTEEATSGAGSNQRADTLMLVHIPADRSKIYSISLMRDLWVGIPDHGHAKINAALAFGGVPLMVQTVESIFGQRIDHIAMIDFEGFVGLTDALGGVQVDIPAPFVSYHDQISFPAGPNTLDGKHALEFVRERYAFADGDYQRVRNQQAFVKALLAKNLSADTLLNPLKVHNVVSAMAPFISVDGGLDAATIAGLAVELKDVRPRDMVMFTLPTRGTGTSTDGQSIVLTDPVAIDALSAAMAADTLGDYVAANGLEGGN
ncbi:LCP family protein [Arthrobacter sp. BE255]|uniref:LCP family protein n=1 Tax=Arthrobacter sp. BE255 TaxID=2817721 RepID=UPI00285ADE5A|nr:LCP family protein [Arthrobacter sp. BE255]MDR7160055.1 LCP family protein required for cell wall assembly [Arthrobacter sp. BE255]